MRKLILLLTITLSLEASAQITFTTQHQVDSFVAVMDTSLEIPFKFIYDESIDEHLRINDLSGFDINVRMLYTIVQGFKWVDMPFFKSFKTGWLEFVDMPELNTFSGLTGIRSSKMTINNCPKVTRFPTKGMLKFNGTIIIINQKVEEFVLDLTDVPGKLNPAQWEDRVEFYYNNIKRLIINAPDGAADKIEVVEDSSLEYLEINPKYFPLISLGGNPKLTTIRGFKKIEFIYPSISDNPLLTDLCAMRHGIKNYYEILSQRAKDIFNINKLTRNGEGASSYEELMAADCSWLADTFTSVGPTIDELSGKIRIYPNPANGQVTQVNVALASNGLLNSVQLWNISGQQIIEDKNLNQTSHMIDTQQLSKGIYIVLITTEKGKKYRDKLVVQ